MAAGGWGGLACCLPQRLGWAPDKDAPRASLFSTSLSSVSLERYAVTTALWENDRVRGSESKSVLTLG